MDNKDSKIVEIQIGRNLRSDVSVSCKCHFNLPVSIKVPPNLDDGTPFPTTYWLTCPMYNKKIGTLESHGMINELDNELMKNSDLKKNGNLDKIVIKMNEILFRSLKPNIDLLEV